MKKVRVKITHNGVSLHEYASAYSVVVAPSAPDDDEKLPVFLASTDGDTTVWACDALQFETAELAQQALEEADLPKTKEEDGQTYPQVILITLRCITTPVEVDPSLVATL